MEFLSTLSDFRLEELIIDFGWSYTDDSPLEFSIDEEGNVLVRSPSPPEQPLPIPMDMDMELLARHAIRCLPSLRSILLHNNNSKARGWDVPGNGGSGDGSVSKRLVELHKSDAWRKINRRARRED